MIDYQVLPCSRIEVRDFIEKHHYSHSINGLQSSYCFKLVDGEQLVGACIYGGLAMAGAWKKYVPDQSLILELRRLVCIDNTPKNTESFFIGRTLRWLKRNTSIKLLVSYADPNYGHTGIIYKASNWKLVGRTSPGRVILWNGKKYHDKAIRTRYNGELKPFARTLKAALKSGEAHYIRQESKYIYTYNLHDR